MRRGHPAQRSEQRGSVAAVDGSGDHRDSQPGERAGTLEREVYLAALHREGLAFGELVSGADLTTPVPSCPGWTLADLVAHLTEVDVFWGRVVHERIANPNDIQTLPRAQDEELVDAYWAGLDRLELDLRSTPDDTPVWTWSDQPADHTAAFVVRRMAHESAIHRWDAATALGRTDPIDAVLASDGIDEFLVHFQSGSVIDGDPSVHVHCTDVAGEWLLTPHGEDYAVSREHAKGTIALRGPASDLLLVLWGRRDVAGPSGSGAVELLGPTEAAARFLARFART